MIPVKHEAKTTSFPFVTVTIMICCVAAYAVGRRLFAGYGLVPLDFMYGLFHPGSGLPTALAMLLLSLFMHGGIFHLAANMWYLWLFGPAMENRAGAFPFTLLYGAAGVTASLVQAASAPLSTIPIVGASGAIAGIMGLTLLLQPTSRLVCYFPPLFFFKVPTFVFLLIWFCIQYINLSAPTRSGTNVAWWAHIGGFLFGMAAGALMRLFGNRGKRRKKRT
jgi:membrane associated rhomboid family serine protease